MNKICTLLLALLCCVAVYADEKFEYTRYVKYPKINYDKLPNADHVKHGEYLVKLGDCAACHSGLKENSQTFAGGLGIKTPFGVFYTPNITPDKETGIGKWTDEQFVKAMHTGIAPGWRHLFPVFPYVYYARVKRQDLLDIKAYLDQVPAVKAPKRKNDVPFPLNIRFLQIGWRLLFFHFQNQGAYEDDPKHDAQWNRGAYLVQGLGHCGMCHTPLNALGGAKNKYFLRGTFVDGYYAPDITADGLTKLSLEDIVKTLHTGKHVNGQGEIHGPMMEVEHNSLRYFNTQDLKAMAVYLKSVHSAKLKTKTVSGSGDDAAKGIYESHCAICHDSGAAGAPKLGDKTTWAPRIKLGLPELYKNAINGINSMPAKGACIACTDEQIKSVVRYMIDAVKHGGGHHLAGAGPKPRKPSLKRGEAIYKSHCQTCHQQAPLKIGDKQAWAPRLHKGIGALTLNVIHGHAHKAAKTFCKQCTDGDVLSAVKYIAQQSTNTNDYHLW